MARSLLGTAIILTYSHSILGNVVSSEIASESFANPSNRVYSYRLPVLVKGEASAVRLFDDRRQARNLYVDPDDERRHDYKDSVISNRFQRSLINYNESAVDRRLNCTKINPHRQKLNWNYTDYNIPVQDRNETFDHHWNRSQSHCGNRFQRNLINYNESAVDPSLNCTKANPHRQELNWNYTDYNIPVQDRNETFDHHRNRSQPHCRRFGRIRHPPHSNRSRPLTEHFGRIHPHSNHSHPNLEDFRQNRTSFNHSRELPERFGRSCSHRVHRPHSASGRRRPYHFVNRTQGDPQVPGAPLGCHGEQRSLGGYRGRGEPIAGDSGIPGGSEGSLGGPPAVPSPSPNAHLPDWVERQNHSDGELRRGEHSSGSRHTERPMRTGNNSDSFFSAAMTAPKNPAREGSITTMPNSRAPEEMTNNKRLDEIERVKVPIVQSKSLRKSPSGSVGNVTVVPDDNETK